ncbi:MAG TPA: NUDIX domain-containing protein [Actinomycetota bacterium]|jgi:ADP-ribose pyrophosphatase YjhB (NUDIX family)
MEECNVHSLISDVAVLAGGSVLLVRYSDLAKYDNEDGWFLPDDVLHHLEHPTRAAKRIAREQVGLNLDEVSLGLIESFRGNDGSWHMSFHHLAELPSVPGLQPASGVAAAEWFRLDNLPPRSEVAHHGWALSVLKKMVGTPIS